VAVVAANGTMPASGSDLGNPSEGVRIIGDEAVATAHGEAGIFDGSTSVDSVPFANDGEAVQVSTDLLVEVVGSSGSGVDGNIDAPPKSKMAWDGDSDDGSTAEDAGCAPAAAAEEIQQAVS
jgi:hypothetical protein